MPIETFDEDTEVARFLDFLEADILHCPQRLQAVDASLVIHINSLVGKVDVDLRASLLPDDE